MLPVTVKLLLVVSDRTVELRPAMLAGDDRALREIGLVPQVHLHARAAAVGRDGHVGIVEPAVVHGLGENGIVPHAAAPKFDDCALPAASLKPAS